MFQMEKQGNILNNKYSMFILGRIHGFNSIASDRKRGPKRKEKEKDIHGFPQLESTGSFWLLAWLKARAQTVSQAPGSLLSAPFPVLAMFSDQLFSHGPHMAAFTPGATSLQIPIL